MLQKIILAISLFFFSFYFAVPVFATYDPLSVPNNKFGIHIFDPNEIEQAAKFVNSGNGSWGYITVPIRANERDLEKWTKFMERAKELKIIPILRIAQYPLDTGWAAPNEWDLIDFANFLDDLPWPVKNRYVIIYNEPNHQGEWGGFVYPEEYARVLSRAVDIFHKKNQDFFVISAGFDSSAPNSNTSMNIYNYISKMEETIPDIFKQVDGLSFHAYGNPAFSAFPSLNSKVNIGSYKYELEYLKNYGIENPKIFLTEVGWRADLIGEAATKRFYLTAYKDYWIEENIVAITPFVFSASAGPFEGFSFAYGDGQLKPFAKEIANLPKVKGDPQMAEVKKKNDNSVGENQKSYTNTSSNFGLFFRWLLLKLNIIKL